MRHAGSDVVVAQVQHSKGEVCRFVSNFRAKTGAANGQAMLAFNLEGVVLALRVIAIDLSLLAVVLK